MNPTFETFGKKEEKPCQPTKPPRSVIIEDLINFRSRENTPSDLSSHEPSTNSEDNTAIAENR